LAFETGFSWWWYSSSSCNISGSVLRANFQVRLVWKEFSLKMSLQNNNFSRYKMKLSCSLYYICDLAMNIMHKCILVYVYYVCMHIFTVQLSDMF